jgi:hypothetical protein
MRRMRDSEVGRDLFQSRRLKPVLGNVFQRALQDHVALSAVFGGLGGRLFHRFPLCIRLSYCLI